MKLKGWRGIALAVVLSAVVVGVTYSLPSPQVTVPGALAAPSGGSGALLSGLGPYAVADVAEKVSPSVVYIEVEYKAQPRSTSRSTGNSFFDFWFGSPDMGQAPAAVSQGSGFIVSADGQVVTNQHVVDNAANIKEIRVYTQGRKEPYKAELLGSDYLLDLAVLKVKPDGKLVPADLGDSNKSRVGEFVVAIGNPYGKDFDHTVTVGVLSAKGREISIPDMDRGEYRKYSNLMQTDAAINPGNSGGPLLNLAGEVIGINTAVRADGQGIGFAIPINVAKDIMNDLVKNGKVTRAWIGIGYGELTKDAAEYLGTDDLQGVLISSVYRNSPASKAGLQPGDIVRSVNGHDIKDMDSFAKITQDMKVGDKLTFVVDRQSGNRTRSVSVMVVVGTRPDDQ